ncbi:hypothetical protein BO86DRAFT_406978 [Aspergillus japonicus CBS 114.51]|uniref:Uncharacterized protein n=1 Tax=Aspergillus japonicus CBS 114.51 TaxID=1448312 RepID=A0A8T8XC69_ASPJA|nr:hypothetical protein BO86DRAFT_406978 [Aspergillus japonicus CBS 114.51]RAH85846.1 hypothetical protein BO86DRAFT_406978 [Aspergillus japonicus CBS 114.51]
MTTVKASDKRDQQQGFPTSLYCTPTATPDAYLHNIEISDDYAHKSSLRPQDEIPRHTFGTINPREKWDINWSDVAPGKPRQANFWLTHYAHQPEFQPIKLNEEPVDIHEESRYQVQPRYDVPCANGWRIWAMEPSKDPVNNKDPIAESEDLNTSCGGGESED